MFTARVPKLQGSKSVSSGPGGASARKKECPSGIPIAELRQQNEVKHAISYSLKAEEHEGCRSKVLECMLLRNSCGSTHFTIV